jgi:hypothetical protein
VDDEELQKHIRASEEESRKSEEHLRALDALDEREKLVEVWKVLEVLTVSLDRLGMYQVFNGEEAAKEALHRFIGPAISEKIADARYLMVSILESRDPKIGDRLEEMAENEQEMGYWNGPT